VENLFRSALQKASRCKDSYFMIWAAWLVYVAAWFLPVVTEGKTLPDGLPGWQAFRVAASAVWPIPDVTIDKWYQAVLFITSAVTTPRSSRVTGSGG
jgi:hypothetical protein